MKTLCRLLIVTILLNVLAPLSSAFAQQQPADNASELLREQIARLESIERDPATSPEVRELNRKFLLARRAQLSAELKKRVDSLEAYLYSGAGILSSAESEAVSTSVRNLKAELQSLGGEALVKNSPKDSNAVKFTPASFTSTEIVSNPTPHPDTTSAAQPQPAGGAPAQGGAAVAASTPECDKMLSDGDEVTYSVVNKDDSLVGKIEKGRIKKDDVKDVIEKTVYTDKKTNLKSNPLDQDYCIVHIIEWLVKGDDQTAASKADVLREHWALYKYQESKENKGQGNGTWMAEAAQKGTRIFGKSRVNVLAIHLQTRMTWDIDYTVSVTKKTPTNIANALDLASIITAGKVGKLPDVAANPIIPARWGGGLMCIKAIPSDIAVGSEIVIRNEQNELVQQPKTYSKTYDNEGKYWWDVSIGVPFKEVKEVQFNSEDGTVTAKEVNRQNAYGFLNLFFGKQDLKGDTFLKAPHLVLGVPISKKPLDNPVIGLGYGFRKFSLKFDFYAGVVFNRVREPRTLEVGEAATPGQLESDLRSKRVRKFIFGVNLPLRQVKEALTGK